jgi:hypothetical protein
LCPAAAGRSSHTRGRELTVMNRQPSTATACWLSSSLVSIARISAISSRRGLPPPSGRIATRPSFSTHQNAPSARCVLGPASLLSPGRWPRESGGDFALPDAIERFVVALADPPRFGLEDDGPCRVWCCGAGSNDPSWWLQEDRSSGVQSR